MSGKLSTNTGAAGSGPPASTDIGRGSGEHEGASPRPASVENAGEWERGVSKNAHYSGDSLFYEVGTALAEMQNRSGLQWQPSKYEISARAGSVELTRSAFAQGGQHGELHDHMPPRLSIDMLTARMPQRGLTCGASALSDAPVESPHFMSECVPLSP